MSSGFNTDVQAGNRHFHVQTEDRGPVSSVIDTTVYQHGRVVLRKSSSYLHFAASDEFDPDDLRERVEEQHRCVIEDLRAGELDAELTAAKELLVDETIDVQLLNPKSWLSAGKVSLEVETFRRADRSPRGGVTVEAAIEGAAQETRHAVTSDWQGRARIQFPMPKVGSGDLALVILATTQENRAEIRFALRSRSKSGDAGSAE